MKKIINNIREYVPTVPLVLLMLVPPALVIHIIGIISPGFADFFNINISPVIRGALSYITGWLPFSLAETIVLSSPILIAAVIIYFFRKCDDKRSAIRYIMSLVSVIAYVYVTFVFTFALGYKGTSVADKLDMDRRDVTAEELYVTAFLLTDMVNESAEKVQFAPNDFSVMPYSHSELTKKLSDAYIKTADKYDFIPHLRSNVKQVVMSEPWTYTHIAGVYTFFTGEANINTNFPDYTIPYTAAHEMSHQRGIAPEDEANFMAFLVCMNSDDDYIRYSGGLNLLEFVMNSLYKADKDLYRECYARIDSHVRDEMRAYNQFYQKYAENVAATVSHAVNDTYLKIQGTEGAKSYGLVTDLAVVYFCDGYYLK